MSNSSLGEGKMLEYRQGNLFFDELPLSNVVRGKSTPLLLLSRSCILQNLKALTEGFSTFKGKPCIRYCAKTNPFPQVLHTLAVRGASMMASHPEEVQQGIDCGFSAQDIAYQRPVLTRPELEKVLKMGIRRLHLYAEGDLKVLEDVLSNRAETVEVSLRLRNDSWKARLSPLNFLSRRLGMSRVEALQVVRQCRNSSKVHLKALNFYIGTQRTRVEDFRPMLRKTMTLVKKIEEEGQAVEEVNIGGGIPSLSMSRNNMTSWLAPRQPVLQRAPLTENLQRFCRGVAAEFMAASSQAGVSNMPHPAVEPGRSIVGNAGIVLTRVIDIRGRWLFLDASRNFLPESPVLFSRDILPLELRKGNHRTVDISGQTLNTTDVLALRRKLPEIRVGDFLVLADAGAYSLSRTSRYAGVPPHVYWLEEGSQLQEVKGFPEAGFFSTPDPANSRTDDGPEASLQVPREKTPS